MLPFSRYYVAPLLLLPLLVHAESYDELLRQQEAHYTTSKQQTEQHYSRQQQQAEAAYQRYRQAAEQKYQQYLQAIDAQWGEAHRAVSTPKQWVQYNTARDLRSRVDFEHGEVRIEVVVNAAEPRAQVTKRLTAMYQRLRVESSRRDAALRVDALAGMATLPEPSALVLKNQMDASSQDEKMIESTRIQTPQGEKTLWQMRVPMQANHLQQRAARYLPHAQKMAAQYHLPTSLIMAVMETESSFNPMAESSAPAYGLMQLVPTSGGRDAYRFVFGEDRIPSIHYLLHAKQNIQLGSAYLSLLSQREMKAIDDPVNRMLCVIAAYNTGARNVARAFSTTSMAQASESINRMDSAQLYAHLQQALPYEETRNYVRKVWQAKARYDAS